MSSIHRSILARVGVAAVLAAGVGIGVAQAQDKSGYITNNDGVIYRSGSGDCVCSIHWTPEKALPECGAPEAEAVQYQPELKEPAMERTVLPAEVLFDFDKYNLKPEGKGALDDLAQRLKQWTNIGTVRVTGHTDRIGSEAYNDRLSMRRAETVANYLRARPGMNALGWEVRGLGERYPIVACDNVSGRAALIKCLAPNRRVEVEVAASRPKQ